MQGNRTIEAAGAGLLGPTTLGEMALPSRRNIKDIITC